MYQLLKYFIMLCFASNRPLPMTLWIAWYAKFKTEKAFTLVHFFQLQPAISGGRLLPRVEEDVGLRNSTSPLILAVRLERNAKEDLTCDVEKNRLGVSSL